MTDTVIPSSIIESYDLAIKRRSKIENAEIDIPLRYHKSDEGEEVGDEDTAKVHSEDKEPVSVFKGYANVIPIRGKDSSLDYYLMVLSKEVFQ
jgi:hypothetical protein